MVAPLIIGAARLAAAALAKQAVKTSGKEVAKKAAVEAAKKAERPSVAKFEKLHGTQPGKMADNMQKQGIPTTKGELAKANKEVTKANKIDPAVTRKGQSSYNANKAQQASKKDSSGYDGVKFDKDDSPYRAGSKMWNDTPF